MEEFDQIVIRFWNHEKFMRKSEPDVSRFNYTDGWLVPRRSRALPHFVSYFFFFLFQRQSYLYAYRPYPILFDSLLNFFSLRVNNSNCFKRIFKILDGYKKIFFIANLAANFVAHTHITRYSLRMFPMLIVGHASNRGKVHATRLRESLWQRRKKVKLRFSSHFTFKFLFLLSS